MLTVSLDSSLLKAQLKQYKEQLTLAFIKTVHGTVGELLNIILQANPVGDENKSPEIYNLYQQREAYSGYAPQAGLSSGSWQVEYKGITPDREVSYGAREASKARFESGKSGFKLGDTVYVHNNVDYIATVPSDSSPGFLGDIGGESFVMQAVKASYAVSDRYLRANSLL